MTEETKNTNTETPTEEIDINKLKEALEYQKAENKKLIQQRDELKTFKRSAEEEKLKAIEEAREKALEQARSKGDISSIEKDYQDKIKKYEDDLIKERTAKEQLLLNTTVKEIASKHLTDNGVKAFLKLYKDDLYFDQDNGNYIPRVKDRGLTVEEIIIKFSEEEFPEFKQTKQKTGMGVNSNNINNTISNYSDVKSLSGSDREALKQKIYGKLRG